MGTRNEMVQLVTGLLFACAQARAATPTALHPALPTGDTFVHDPSTVLRHGDRYFLFSTGVGIQTLSSPDLLVWTKGKPVFDSPPAWTTNAVAGFRGHFWAPDVIRLNGQYHLYYSVSTFGKQVSAIGLATNPTLDAASPDYRWTDRGPVIQSAAGGPFNAIDPAMMVDADGQLWMTFGSFWQGIHLVQLDAETGLRRAADSPIHRLAWKESIEAPCLLRRGDFYYLFVNWGLCCRGTNSTYEIRVGRSARVTGPYVDRDGKDMVDGGGSPFLATAGRLIGPGHIGILSARATELFTYHYYDPQARGRSRLAVGKLTWAADGWPVAVTVD
jgi:arabinan endo-1,5-alpha-L-arabinosidase